MPTGYTHQVQDGTVTEFSEFAMRCARAFGALITMRDVPDDAAVSERIEPDGSYENRIKEAKDEIARLMSMSVDAQERSCQQASDEAEADWKRRETERAEQRGRYEAMLSKVQAWTPPTQDHIELKKFMESQLVEGIRSDCSHVWAKPDRKRRSEWYEESLKRATSRLSRAEEEHAKDVEHARRRTEWIAALRKSLAT